MIMATRIRHSGITAARALCFGRNFGRYMREDPKPVRPQKIEEDKTLKKLKEAWNVAASQVRGYGRIDIAYGIIFGTIKDIEYTARDVEKFSIVIAEFQNQGFFYIQAGLFLSALINNGTDTEYTIQTKHLEKWWISKLGYRNTKIISVNGSIGSYLGNEMNGGKITVWGNVGGGTGYEMYAGEIKVWGNADDETGVYMKGGKIIVEGNVAGSHLGSGMRGGEIYINGDQCEVRDLWLDHGRIYHKGKLILDK